MIHVPVLVMGGGLTGLTAAHTLGSEAFLIEREERAGGLVRTHRVGNGWFDHVLHLLHIADPTVESFLAGIDGLHLEPCPPHSTVETRCGVARFPIQLHVGDLGEPTASRIVSEIEARENTPAPDPETTDYATLLEHSFGPTLKDLFFGPYNSKLWRRPLELLVPTGQTWNLKCPSSAEVREGASPGAAARGGYNARGFYPRPPKGSALRGMEVLASAIARGVTNLRLRHEIVSLDLKCQSAKVRNEEGITTWAWEYAALATLPLPRLAAMADGLPSSLRDAASRLAFQRVRSVALLVEGERPDLGHWRYYPDPSLLFHRLTFLHAFDPDLASPGCWPLLAEFSENGRSPPTPESILLNQTESGARRVGVLKSSDRIVAHAVFNADPGYVVFEPGVHDIVNECRQTFARSGITLGGRYGAWEYGSMATAIAAGLDFAKRLSSDSIPGRPIT